MKYFFLLISFITFFSCSKESMNCDCSTIKGKRYYINVSESFFKDCVFADEMEFTKSGSVVLYRTGNGDNQNRLPVLLKYDIVNNENCQIKFYDLKMNGSTLPQCHFSYSILHKMEGITETTVPFTNITCNSFNIGAITHVDFNPRG